VKNFYLKNKNGSKEGYSFIGLAFHVKLIIGKGGN